MLSGAVIIIPIFSPAGNTNLPEAALAKPVYGDAEYAMSSETRAVELGYTFAHELACPRTAILLMTTSRPPVLVIVIAPTALPVVSSTQICWLET